jgi:hypothetical protein
MAAQRLPLSVSGRLPVAGAFASLAQEIDVRLAAVRPGPKLGRSQLLEFLESEEARASQRNSSS